MGRGAGLAATGPPPTRNSFATGSAGSHLPRSLRRDDLQPHQDLYPGPAGDVTDYIRCENALIDVGSGYKNNLPYDLVHMSKSGG